jgi:hypothetical protein
MLVVEVFILFFEIYCEIISQGERPNMACLVVFNQG